LYSYQQSQVKEILPYEKALLQSVDKVYEMYIWLLSLLIEVADYSLIDAEDRANKHLPSEEDLNASVKIQNNLFIISLRQNLEYLAAIKKYKISWDFDPEVRKTIFITLKASEEYKAFLALSNHTIQKDKDIIKFIFKKLILKSPGIEQIFEEKFINWSVDKEVLKGMMAKTLKNFKGTSPQENSLAPLLQDEQEDRYFVLELLKKTINHQDEFLELIDTKTTNWDSDRIALMDVLLMQMAITELVHFKEIPVKVTINEYIEISKDYSTPKSNSFINGILDKILADLKKNKQVLKVGRGLLN
jgi:N utilization substance protein B